MMKYMGWYSWRYGGEYCHIQILCTEDSSESFKGIWRIIVYLTWHFKFIFEIGEVPGLYKIEELEPLLSTLKDQASQDGFTGPIFNYFTCRMWTEL